MWYMIYRDVKHVWLYKGSVDVNTLERIVRHQRRHDRHVHWQGSTKEVAALDPSIAEHFHIVKTSGRLQKPRVFATSIKKIAKLVQSDPRRKMEKYGAASLRLPKPRHTILTVLGKKEWRTWNDVPL